MITAASGHPSSISFVHCGLEGAHEVQLRLCLSSAQDPQGPHCTWALLPLATSLSSFPISLPLLALF